MKVGVGFEPLAQAYRRNKMQQHYPFAQHPMWQSIKLVGEGYHSG